MEPALKRQRVHACYIQQLWCDKDVKRQRKSCCCEDHQEGCMGLACLVTTQALRLAHMYVGKVLHIWNLHTNQSK